MGAVAELGLSVERDGSMLVTAIEQILDRSGSHPGFVGSLISDRSDGHEERWLYIRDRVTGPWEAAQEQVDILKGEGLVRDFDLPALFMLMNIGVSSVASAPASAQAAFGFDFEGSAERRRFAEALADIIQFGLVVR